MRGWKLWTCVFHFMLFGLIAERAIAGPPLTTIQDVIYKADGTRFNGVAYIEWKSFQTPNQVSIGTQSLTVPIVDGNLRVRLVPTTNSSTAGYYHVRFHSDGRIQFSEMWAVPPTTSSISLATVRAAALQQTGGGVLGPAALSIGEVTGLAQELAARPVSGLGYASNRAVRTGASGALEAVTGNLTDCVRVDGTSAPCESGGGSYIALGFVDGETPAGLANGSNTVFSLSSQPSPALSLELYRNGVYLTQGIDYSLSANSITMVSAATPTLGDVLTARYRTAAAGNPTSAAGGALTGNYPNPQIAAGVISNSNIAAVAGIVESKLALNFPTHTSANDPNAAEKAALSGTAGSPSATNKYVTTSDGRLTDARTALAHPLLNTSHSDTTAGMVARGDLIVGQGASPSWAKLSLGTAGRCLTSNGVDAIWNTCLYTGFQPGTIPIVNASGNLSENITQLRWDTSNRRFSVGSTLAESTVNIHDQSGATGLIVRSGTAQGIEPLTRWQNPSGVDLATVQSDGAMTGLAVQVSPTTARAPWRDAGLPVDPASRVDGDGWYNSGMKARKTHESGQTHTVSQVICAEEGAANSTTSAQVIAACAIPPGFLQVGDRIEVLVDAEQVGAFVPWNLRVQWGSTELMQRAMGAGDVSLAVRGQASLYSNGTRLSTQHFNANGAMLTSIAPASDPFQAGLSLAVSAWLNSTAAGANVVVRNLTIIRHPAQVN